MPINHIITRPFPRDDGHNAPENSEEKLQHSNEYNYAEICSRDKVFEAIETIQAEEVRLHEEEQCVLAMEQRAIDAELEETVPFVEKANSHMIELKASLKRMATEDLHHIHNTTGLKEFIVGGSWVSVLVQKLVSLIFEDDERLRTLS